MSEFNVIIFLTDQVNFVVCRYAVAGPVIQSHIGQCAMRSYSPGALATIALWKSAPMALAVALVACGVYFHAFVVLDGNQALTVVMLHENSCNSNCHRQPTSER